MTQIDLFSSPVPPETVQSASGRRDEKLAKWARELEQSGDYRILRRLIPRSLQPAPLTDGEKIGVIVDVETTGLDHTKDEVIELGMVKFTYGGGGNVLRVLGVFSELRQPSSPIPVEITRLTGITDDMVAGKSIDVDAVVRFIDGASIIIAHNAKFDRPFCEGLADTFSHLAWACSLSEINWSGLGFEGAKLGYLLSQLGWFHNGHRASDDCHALLEVLAAELPGGVGTGLKRLLDAVGRERHRIWAERSPFEFKDILKARGYRWSDGADGRPKSWWTEVADDESEAELTFLRSEIYQRDIDIRVQRLSAIDRFKA
jgi:DNA polymerase-3 subunit epsilon